MDENIIKKTDNYGLYLIPEESGRVAFRQFRTLLMGGSESNMQKIDSALSRKGSKLSVGAGGSLELRDERDSLLSSVSADKFGGGKVQSVNGQTGAVTIPEGFSGIRIFNESATQPSEQWMEATAEELGGELNIYPGENISIEIDGDGMTINSKFNAEEIISAVLEAIPNGNGVKY